MFFFEGTMAACHGELFLFSVYLLSYCCGSWDQFCVVITSMDKRISKWLLCLLFVYNVYDVLVYLLFLLVS